MHTASEKILNKTAKNDFLVEDDFSVQNHIKRLPDFVSQECISYRGTEDLPENLDSDRAGCRLLDICIPGTSGLELQKIPKTLLSPQKEGGPSPNPGKFPLRFADK